MKKFIVVLLAIVALLVLVFSRPAGADIIGGTPQNGSIHHNTVDSNNDSHDNNNSNVNRPVANARGGNAESNAVGIGVGIGKGGRGGDGGNANAVAAGGQGGSAEQAQRQQQDQVTDVDVRNRNNQDTDVSTNVNTGVNTTVGNKGVVRSNNDNRSSAEQQSVVETNVQVEGNNYSSNYTDESIYASIATQPGKSEVQIGVPGLAAITLSDDTKVSTLNLTLHTTLELYKAGLVSEEDARAIVAEELQHLRKAANGPRGRTLFNLFGILR